MKRALYHITIFSFFLAVVINFFGAGCDVIKREGFSIYLTKEDIPPSKMEALSHIELAEPSIITVDDIVAYYGRTHEIALTAEAYERIANLEVPVEGRSFMVCVERVPIYWGAFWTPISSMSFNGVTIWKPLTSNGTNIIQLELGYPSSSFYGGEDPRNNTQVLNFLKKAGKLVTTPLPITVDEIPHSLKGYEIYSWLEDNQWHFTLITGTNRNKTLDEVISYASVISENGWVRIHVVGEDAIKDIINKIPKGEFVFWFNNIQDDTQEIDVDIQLPPSQIVDYIKQSADQIGLVFQVQPQPQLQ
jgi:hypothetical protein